MPFLAYFAVLLIAAAGAVFGLDLLTAPLPQEKPAVHQRTSSTPKAIRQIPIGRTTADDIGDPDGKLSPVYPARPLEQRAETDKKPPAEPTDKKRDVDATKVDENKRAEKPAVTPPQPAAAPTQDAPQRTAQNSCNVQACTSAYSSFRAEDCTYQPYDGPRRLCENPPAPRGQIASRSRERRPETVGRGRDELDDVARDVKQLTARDMIEDGAYRRRGAVIIMQEPDDDAAVLRPPREIGR